MAATAWVALLAMWVAAGLTDRARRPPCIPITEPNGLKQQQTWETKMFRNLAFAAALAAPLSAFASDAETPHSYMTTTEGDFADVVSFLEEAIINEGLVIDYRGHLGDMLARTGADVGHESPYANAQYMVFCSAKLTHEAVAADPASAAICPYTVFAYELAERPGEIHVGYRKPLAGDTPEALAALSEIDALLRRIVAATVE